MNIQECQLGYYSVKENTKVVGMVIFLHGYGSFGQDLAECFIPIFQSTMQDHYYFSPNAIQKYQNTSAGYQWFDIDMTSNDANVTTQSIHDGLNASSDEIVNMLNTQVNHLRSNYQVSDAFKVVLVGFSQGAMVALHLGCNGLIDHVHKVVAFSGAFCYLENYQYKNKDLQIMLLHGKEDQVIQPAYSDNALDKLQALGFFNVKMRKFDNLAHGVNYEGIILARDFIYSQ